MNWIWLHKWGSPKWFYDMSGKCMPWLIIASTLLLTVALTWGLVFAPPDYQQGNSFRIISVSYTHLTLPTTPYV